MKCEYCEKEYTEEEMKTKSKCIYCHRKQAAEYMREYNKNNPEKKKERKIKYLSNPENREKKKEARKKYLSNPENREKKIKHDKEYYEKNKEEIRKKVNEEYKNNPDKQAKKRDLDKKYNEQVKNDPDKKAKRNEKNREYQKRAMQDPEKAEKIRKNRRESAKRNRESINKYRNEKRRTDDNFRIADNLRHGLKRVLKIYGQEKNFSSLIDRELCARIIEKIGNRPSKDYHLDHIIPLTAFNLTIERHRELVNSPENLRWLPGKENQSKKDKIDLQLIYCSLSITLIAKEIGII